MPEVLRHHSIDLRAFHKATRGERQAMLADTEAGLAAIRAQMDFRKQRAAHARRIAAAERREILAICKRRAARIREAEGKAPQFQLTRYARALVNSIGRTPERVEDVIAAARHFTGPRGPGLTCRKEDEDLFTTAYYFGSQLAAGNPRRPLDRSGITKPKT